MDWKDVPKYGKDGRFITEDEFRDAVIDVASDLAVKVSPKSRIGSYNLWSVT